MRLPPSRPAQRLMVTVRVLPGAERGGDVVVGGAVAAGQVEIGVRTRVTPLLLRRMSYDVARFFLDAR